MKESWIHGSVVVLDGVYGNLWTNIGWDLLEKSGVKNGTKIEVKIRRLDGSICDSEVLFNKIFGEVNVGEPIAYVNSVEKLAFGINQVNFAEEFEVGSGSDVYMRAIN